MSLVFVNGFDDQMLTIVTASNGMQVSNFDTGTFRNGTTSYKARVFSGTTSYPDQYIWMPIPGGGDATVVVGAACQRDGVGNTFYVAQLLSDNGSTIHVTVTLNVSTGVLTAYRGAGNGTVLGTATLSGPALLPATWGYWEVKAVLSDTVGEVHVRFNSAAVLDVTGVDTKNGGTKTVFDSLCFPCSNGVNTYFDDMYVVTGSGSAPTDFLGDCKVQTLYPNGNGDFSQMVGSDADSVNNYALVNETGPPNTTSYVESATVGGRDFYAMGDLSGLPGTASVLAVQVSAWCNNADGGSARTAKLGVRQGTSETLSSGQALTAVTFLPVRGIFTADPASGTGWSQSGVNSMQAGIEVA